MDDDERDMDFLPRLNFFKEKLQRLEQEAKSNSGKMRSQDSWAAIYFRDPYMIRLTEAQLFERFCDIYSNLVEIDETGKLTPKPMRLNDDALLRKWTHLLEETGSRGGIKESLVAAANEQLQAYFADGAPPGVRLFSGVQRPKSPFLVKFSKKEFIEKMYYSGEIRVSPASLYSDGSLLHAMQDLETKRNYTIPAYNNLMEGQKSVELDGTLYDITQSDPSVSLEVPNYFLYSLCADTDRRMPTDFQSDAALVIKDKRKFLRRFLGALAQKLPGWKTLTGAVSYYDPLLDFQRYHPPEMTKHIRFHYQKEFRILAKTKKVNTRNLEPFFVSIGSMQDYSEIFSIS